MRDSARALLSLTASAHAASAVLALARGEMRGIAPCAAGGEEGGAAAHGSRHAQQRSPTLVHGTVCQGSGTSTRHAAVCECAGRA